GGAGADGGGRRSGAGAVGLWLDGSARGRVGRSRVGFGGRERMSAKGTNVSPRREIEEIYPLTPMQEGMLFHALLAPGGEEYFEQLNVRIEGELEAALLRRAFAEMTAAHGILRTGFNWEKRKEPFQIVYRAVEVP